MRQGPLALPLNRDRKSTRLNSSHITNSYAVFCMKKKKAGLGAMGFGYPAALGAKVAHPDKQVVDIDGDGSFLMNVQELATAHIEKIAAKVMILNNQHLGMVVQWEDKFYQGNRGNTYLGDPENMKQIYPDYITMAKAFNVPCE